jgi:hypothetical protein
MVRNLPLMEGRVEGKASGTSDGVPSAAASPIREAALGGRCGVPTAPVEGKVEGRRPYRIEYRDREGIWRYYATASTPRAASTVKVWDACHYGMRVIDKRTGRVVVAWSGRDGCSDWTEADLRLPDGRRRPVTERTP